MTLPPHLPQLGSLENLEEQLHRNFLIMREIDSRTKKLTRNADHMAKDLMFKFKEYSSDKKKEIMTSIQQQFDYAKYYSNDKVQLSKLNYELVDANIRQLDSHIAHLKAKIEDRHTSATNITKDGSQERCAKSKIPYETDSLYAVLAGAGIADMPVDPNEPIYCLCNQVSFGEMIKCDNPDCPIEWFHFECLKLTTTPKGKWFCSKCKTDRKKKQNNIQNI